MPGGHVREYCQFSDAGFDRFKAIIDSSRLSTRSMDRLAKVSRTVADLASADTIDPPHLDKAAQFVVGGMLREQG
jgi:magnesium chelatase family protein